MKFVTFVRNDDVKCFLVFVQGTHKLVVMGCVNFEDRALIKKWQVGKKMNVTGEMFMDEINEVIVESNLRLLLEVVSVFQSFGAHSNKNAKNAIEKL